MQNLSHQEAHSPSWIVFPSAKRVDRLPFYDPTDNCSGWQYVLDMTSLGFRADRIRDAIVITGRQCGFAGGMA